MEVLVSVDAGPGADKAETAELTSRLRSELVEHGLDPLAPPGPAPPLGAKGLPTGELASLLVVLAASGGVLTTLIGVLQAWLTRQSDSRIVLEIDGDRLELVGSTDDERRRALEFWLARHEPGAASDARSGGSPAA